jgi:PTH1 family peptidyl-tRNA hydrolase
LFLVAGLGNPGDEYAGNRHNLGFMVADEVSRRLGVHFRSTKMEALVADIVSPELRVLLAKPQTFMNLSGRSVKLMAAFFKIPGDRILVIHDDMDLPFGEVRLKDTGGSAGHNGVQSVIDSLGTQDFKRLRIGIGRPPGSMDPAKFVLQNFSSEERKDLDFIVGEAADIVLKTVENARESA